ncbi:MAG: hypothetical protein Q9216_002693 [Gyalolechia sp. 2 TL-2023]
MAPNQQYFRLCMENKSEENPMGIVSQSFEQSARSELQHRVTLDSHHRTTDLQKNMDVTSAFLLGLSFEQRKLFQSLIESNRQLVHANERMTDELQQMRCAVQLQLELPPQVPLQKPITLLDACGKVSAFHLDFINCSEAFLAVLKIRFQQYGVQDRGIQMLDDSQFVLEDYKGKLDLSKPWSKVLRPSQKVDMSMVFRRDVPSSTCPACQMVNEDNSDSRIECHLLSKPSHFHSQLIGGHHSLRCGLFYQRVEGEMNDFERTEKAGHDTAKGQHIGLTTDRREHMGDEEHNDLFDQFRRVQLICLRPRQPLLACPFQQYGCDLSFSSKREWKRHLMSRHLNHYRPHHLSWNRAVSSSQNVDDANGTPTELRTEDVRPNLSSIPLLEASEVGAPRRGSMVDSSDTASLLERLDERASQKGIQYLNKSEHWDHDGDHMSRMRRDTEQPLQFTEPGTGVSRTRSPENKADFSDTIRDVATFDWSLTGTDEPLAQDGQGKSTRRMQPPENFPVRKTRATRTQQDQSTSTPPHSPFHLFDMSAALLNNVEKNHRRVEVPARAKK